MNDQDIIEDYEAKVKELSVSLRLALDRQIMVETLKSTGLYLYISLNKVKYNPKEIKKWVEKNCTEDYYMSEDTGDFLFKSEKDMVLFKLTWE